jgi:hypothetical protein
MHRLGASALDHCSRRLRRVGCGASAAARRLRRVGCGPSAAARDVQRAAHRSRGVIDGASCAAPRCDPDLEPDRPRSWTVIPSHASHGASERHHSDHFDRSIV